MSENDQLGNDNEEMEGPSSEQHSDQEMEDENDIEASESKNDNDQEMEEENDIEASESKNDNDQEMEENDIATSESDDAERSDQEEEIEGNDDKNVPQDQTEKKTKKKSRKRNKRQDAESDPHNFEERYIRTHMRSFDRALKEIKAGHKQSCWSWFILPSAPWIVNGQERGSGTNSYYALRTDEQARAYLKYTSKGVNLRQNYIDIWTAAAKNLEAGVKFRDMMGFLDDPKARSSLRLFERISREENDTEVHDICTRVMKIIKEKPDMAHPKLRQSEKCKRRRPPVPSRCARSKKKRLKESY